MLKLCRHKQYLKDFKKINMSEQHYVKFIVYLSKLLAQESLPQEALSHPLKGEFTGFTELHISGDLLLIYRVEDDTLELIRIGTHSQLFT